MMVMLRTGIVSVVLFSLTACGTVLERSANGFFKNEYYRGTKSDLLSVVFYRANGENSVLPVVCYFMIVCPIFTVVSLPVDIAMDTLLLPVDAINRQAEDEAL
ncbi:YceK/YidQ family lipoprotein [Pseudomonas sp. M30-35]|uniref:YceK/YidQ family lipoprotein n=1 Tax=Pseudomonas sp. M30-35 TaxID=1981174 RepID=UPI0012FDB6C5|nr:YceK/YidQ family lipoprotein [Pseudomonas sp. M30-35]